VDHLKQHNKEEVINWKDNEGNTALHCAVAAKNFEASHALPFFYRTFPGALFQ